MNVYISQTESRRWFWWSPWFGSRGTSCAATPVRACVRRSS